MRPHERDEALLQDMVVHCREVQEFTRGVGLEQLMRDRRLCLLIERCLEIVGEAASRVSQEFRDAHAQIPWQEIRGLRNVLAHEKRLLEANARTVAVATWQHGDRRQRRGNGAGDRKTPQESQKRRLENKLLNK